MDDTRQEAFFIWCNHKGHDFEKVDANDLVSSFDDEYQGEYDYEEDFAYQTLKSATNCRSLPKPTLTMPSLPVIYFAATTGWRTVLYFGQLKISIRAGHRHPAHKSPSDGQKQICKIVLRLVLLFTLYRFASITAVH